jgi:hypothetical protein
MTQESCRCAGGSTPVPFAFGVGKPRSGRVGHCVAAVRCAGNLSRSQPLAHARGSEGTSHTCEDVWGTRQTRLAAAAGLFNGKFLKK